MAELGVYRGDFAKKINEAFPDRKFYLFDTFEGFDERDVCREHSSGFSSGTQNFSGTSINSVLRKMRNPANCVVKKGFFPETAKGLEEHFAFVSIDADLYEPIYEGLKYFYPRLSAGGYVFIHDYNNDSYRGAAKAVKKFCAENRLSFVPLSDLCGTVVLTK